MKRFKILGAGAAALLLIAALASCGAASTAPQKQQYDSSSSSGAYSKNGSASYGTAAVTTAAYPMYSSPEAYMDSLTVYETGTSQEVVPEEERKIITTCNIYAETKEFDAAVAGIEAGVRAQGGYIESSDVSGVSLNRTGYATSRYATYTLRIPAAGLENYVTGLEGLFNITAKSQNADDISDTYYDTQARLESYQIQEQRLLSMLEKSDDLQSLLQLEDKLSEVRYQIERLTATMKRYDSSVSYSTVYLYLSEVIEYTDVEKPVTFGERISTAFSNSWHDFAESWKTFCVEFTYALPVILVFLVFAAVILIIVCVNVRRHRKKKNALKDKDTAKDKE